MTYHYSPNLTIWHNQIIMGTILGGSSVVKPTKGLNCYLFMRSCNQDWVKYKAEELKELASENAFTLENSTLRWHSNCYPVFNKFRDMFYEGKKKVVKMEVLDMLMDTALAIWYIDKGSILKNKAVLNTSNFEEEGTQTIVKYFNEVGIECKILKERSRFKVQFTKEGTLKLFSTIGHRLPSFLAHTIQI